MHFFGCGADIILGHLDMYLLETYLTYFIQTENKRLSYTVDAIADDERLTQEPGHQQEWYWLCSHQMSPFQHQKDYFDDLKLRPRLNSLVSFIILNAIWSELWQKLMCLIHFD